MSLHIDCQYLQIPVPGVGYLMGPIEDTLREAFLPVLFGGGEVSTNLREIQGHSVKRGGLGIPDPCLSEERAYNTSKSASEVLIGSILGGTDLNYVVHKGWIRRASTDRRKQRELAEKAVLLIWKELANREGLNRLR